MKSLTQPSNKQPNNLQHTRVHIRYGPEIETRIEKLERVLTGVNIGYPLRWTAIKLLEGDSEIVNKVGEKHPDVIVAANILAGEISEIHKEPCSTVISSERYAVAARIVKEVQTFKESEKPSMGERFDALSMHSVWGYVLMFTIMLSILMFMSFFGGWLSETVRNLFESVNPHMTGFWPDLLWNGGVVGLYATLSVALGFILPFYLILGVLEDSGISQRLRISWIGHAIPSVFMVKHASLSCSDLAVTSLPASDAVLWKPNAIDSSLFFSQHWSRVPHELLLFLGLWVRMSECNGLFYSMSSISF